MPRPHAATSLASHTFVYDPSGNLTSDTGNPTSVANSWNYRNELTNTAIAQTSVAYRYDSAGMRTSLREITPSGTTVTNFPTPAYSETVKPDNSVERTVSVEVAGIPVATVRTVDANVPEIFADHTDHLGSTRLATDQTGAVVEKTDYDPFGKIVSHIQTGDFTERKKFTGHEFDSATNYTYAKARYLDTGVGRFVSEDKANWDDPKQFLADPQQFNSYSYARNNPLKFVDPTGESVRDVVFYGGGFINAVSSNFLFGAGRASINDSSYQRGQFAGDVFSTGLGAIEAGIGATVAAGGGALCLSGVGCAAGAPAVAAGAAVAAHGAGVAGVAGENAAGYLFSKSGEGTNQAGGDSTREIANSIAKGHASEKHLGEFKSLGVETQSDFAEHIESVIKNPTQTRSLNNGRTVYMNEQTKTIVIYDPKNKDSGTAFIRQKDIKGYFKKLK